MPRCAAATASPRAPSFVPFATRNSPRSTRCAPIPRPPPRAVNARGQVEALLAFARRRRRGQDRQGRCANAPTPAMTKSAGHLARKLKSMAAVMQRSAGRSRTAAHKCRPALNYYLLCAWPGEYRDDSQSRFINERVHANIQKDGTYSVVPRMWGGVTTPAELRAIADVADKFDIPTVKVTGGQRIDLLGVKKEDLPAVWARSQQGGPRLGPCLRQGAAHGEDLRRHPNGAGSARKIPPGSASSWRSCAGARGRRHKVKLGGVRLPAQLRRGDHQGHRRGLRRRRLRHHGRRQWRHRSPRHRRFWCGSRPKTKCWNIRRVPPALSRGGALPRAHANGSCARA